MLFTKYQILNSWEELGEDGIVIISDVNGLPKQIPIKTRVGVRIVIGNYGEEFCMFTRAINNETKEAAVIVADKDAKAVAEFNCAKNADENVQMKIKLLKDNIPNFKIIFDGNRNDAYKS